RVRPGDQLARPDPELLEPPGGQVAAAAPEVGGPVEQDVRELERLAHDRRELETPAQGGGARVALPLREQPGQRHADAAGDGPAVVTKLALVVEAGGY